MTYLRTEVDGWTVFDDAGPSEYVGSVERSTEVSDLHVARDQWGKPIGSFTDRDQAVAVVMRRAGREHREPEHTGPAHAVYAVLADLSLRQAACANQPEGFREAPDLASVTCPGCLAVLRERGWLPEPTPNTKEQNIAFRKDWDARVEAGLARGEA